MKEIETIQRGINHRPFNPESTQHQQFLKNTQEKITAIKELHPHIKFDIYSSLKRI
jgi:hypothetical protein